MKANTNINPIILLMPIFIILASCGQQKAKWKGTIEQVDGVTVVKNPQEPIFAEDVLELEEGLILGEKEGREEYMFTRIMIDVDDDENIYVLDNETANIRVFDKEGEYIRTIGRRGQGPGEMQSPRLIQITPQNEIMVYDMRNRRILFFSLDGTFLRQLSAATQLAFLRLQMDSEENYFGYVLNREGGIELKKFDSKLQPIATLFSERVIKEKIIRLVYLRLLFSLTKEGSLVWGYSEKYELHVVGPEGKILSNILKEYDPIDITNEDKERIMNERFSLRGIPPGYTLECPEYYPPFKSLFTDEDGRMFLETYENCEDGGCYSDVFDSEGRYIAKVRLGLNPVWLVWKKNKLYTIERDEEGYMFVKFYSAKWNI